MMDLNVIPLSRTTKQQQEEEDITRVDQKLPEEDQTVQLFTVTKGKTAKQPSPGATTEMTTKDDNQATSTAGDTNVTTGDGEVMAEVDDNEDDEEIMADIN